MQYEMTGYGTRWGNSRVGRAHSNFRNNVLHRPLGWYDLHVKLTSA